MSKRIQLLSIATITILVGACDRGSEGSKRAVETSATVPTGGICGGTAGATCSAADDFCKQPAGQCSSTGVCAPRPQECPLNIDPVCGCDGKTHSNECFAYAAGVSVRSKGACPPVAPEQPRNVALPSVRIVPEVRAGGAKDYCRLADRPGGKDLIVRLRNPRPSSRSAMNMSVGFTGTPNSIAQATSPPIPPSGTVEVRVPVPGNCFSGDCRFVIKVQDPNGAVQAEGSCLG